MLTTCDGCGMTVGTSVAVGMLSTGIPAAIVTGVLCGFLMRVSPWFAVAGLPGWLATTWLFWEGPRWLAAVRNRFRRCPRCGACNWGRPRYGGFGL